jgi:hypothetical protein
LRPQPHTQRSRVQGIKLAHCSSFCSPIERQSLVLRDQMVLHISRS